jgi:DNA-binding Lrp family transcriptional regulator
MNTFRFRLLNDFQRNFPLCVEPFAAIASACAESPETVIAEFSLLREQGVVGRIGAAFRPGAIGAGTLAAMAVPPERLDHVAALVGSCLEVNHNYEREHHFNLWFVATAPDHQSLSSVLRKIESDTELQVLAMPLLEEYHIDLGFDLTGRDHRTRNGNFGLLRSVELDAKDRALIAALENGLPTVPRPYQAIGELCDMSEARVIARLAYWQQTGVIRRFGVVVRHLELGFRANAMAVWDVPDDEVAGVGGRLARHPGVNLCYRRARNLPNWRYNLYCMIHDKERSVALERIREINGALNLRGYSGEVLLSTRRFKQTGPHYSKGKEPLHGCA